MYHRRTRTASTISMESIQRCKPQLLVVVMALHAVICMQGLDQVSACTSGMYRDPKDPTQLISWRLLDLPSSYFNQMAWVPSGSTLDLLPVKNLTWSSLGKSVTTKNDFVCLTSSREALQLMLAKYVPGLKMDGKTWPGGCGDGMNSKGLAVGELMQLDSTGINSYKGSGPAVEQVDFVTYLLAMYDDVPSIILDLEAKRLNPIANPAMSPMIKLMFNTTFTTLHYNIMDKDGKGLVIEYSGPNNLQWWDNSKYGVLANNPLWTPQTQYATQWIENNADPYMTIHGSSCLNMPGSYNSSHRFMRAMMLQQPGYNWEWPEFIAISPKYTWPGMPSTNPALISAQNIIKAVYLPKGVDDAGGQQCFEAGCISRRDIVWFEFLRDHKELAYYWRVANNPQYKRIAFKEVDWNAIRASGSIQYVWMQPGVWWRDESNKWKASRQYKDPLHKDLLDELRRVMAIVKA